MVSKQRCSIKALKGIKTASQRFYVYSKRKRVAELEVTICYLSWGGARYRPNASTEQGAAMLSSVLNSKTAIDVNIRIIRVFTLLREYALTHKEILLQLSRLEKEVKATARTLKTFYNAQGTY